MESIVELRQTLLRGIGMSKQSSLARRSPRQEAVPDLEAARQGLRELVKQKPNDQEAWQLLSQAEECLLNYGAAVQCLERAMALSKARNKKDLKRLALLKGAFKEWNELPLSPEQLADLGKYLELAGALDERHGRTLEHTKRWLEINPIPDPEGVIEALGRRGAYTDFQVLYNVVRG